MASKTCNVSGCTMPLYVESKCYRHFKTEDRIKDSEGAKAKGNEPAGGTLTHPAGTKATKQVPERKTRVAGQDDKK